MVQVRKSKSNHGRRPGVPFPYIGGQGANLPGRYSPHQRPQPRSDRPKSDRRPKPSKPPGPPQKRKNNW